VAVRDVEGTFYEVEEIRVAKSLQVGLETDLSLDINELFDQGISTLRKFVESESDAQVPEKEKDPGLALGMWINRVKNKAKHKKTKISSDGIAKLPELSDWIRSIERKDGQLSSDRITELKEFGLLWTQNSAKQGKPAKLRAKNLKFVEAERSAESDNEVNPSGAWFRFEKVERAASTSGVDRYSRTNIKVPLRVKRV
jgi:hypothetical protein